MQSANIQRPYKMAQIKWALIIADFLGIPITIMGIIENFNSVRGAVLLFVSLVYLMSRTYYSIVKNQQAVRDKELDLWHKEQEAKAKGWKAKNKK